jgi:UDPglucose 6-dehydrogenase
MRVSVVGIGYVGLVVSGCLSAWGHRVTGIEANRDRLQSLKRGDLPFHEPGLEELVRDGVTDGRLSFGSDPALIANSDVVIVAVGTHDGNGGWQTASLLGALDRIVPLVRDDATLAVRSTVPPSLINDLGDIVAGIRAAAERSPIAVVLNPEFTREGSAVGDFFHPDRVVIGVVHDPDARGVGTLKALYAAVDAPFVVATAIDAAMIKLASNLFLATKISFANELAHACDAFGASIDEVLGGMALDPRIGGSFMRPGVGFGGSCLPHQLRMTVLDAAAIDLEMPILAAADETNRRQPERFVERMADGLGGLAGRRIGLLGLTFKPGTDDLREAPSLDIASRLLEAGAEVVAYDPMERARAGAQVKVIGLRTTDRVAELFDEADAIGLVTEWPEFAALDWRALGARMRGRLVVDGRNALHPDDLHEAGFSYIGFGRPARTVDRVAQVVELNARRGKAEPEHEIAAVV